MSMYLLLVDTCRTYEKYKCKIDTYKILVDSGRTSEIDIYKILVDSCRTGEIYTSKIDTYKILVDSCRTYKKYTKYTYTTSDFLDTK